MTRNSEAVVQAFAELENVVRFEKQEALPSEAKGAPRRQPALEPAEARNSKAVESDGMRDPDIEQQIRDRAFCIYVERGSTDGHAMDDWLAAELELLANR